MPTVLTSTNAVNAAIAGARSLPALIARLRIIDPELATQLITKPLLLTRSPWGTAAAGLIGLVAARYGFNWNQDTTEAVAGIAVLAGGFAMRAITKQPVAGVIATPPGIPPAPPDPGVTAEPSLDPVPTGETSMSNVRSAIAVFLTTAALAACAPSGTSPTLATTMAAPVPVAVTSNVQIALNAYQAALGVAQVALAGNPGLSARLTVLQAQAAPYVAAVQAGTTMAASAPSLAALTAELLVEAAPYITAIPNGKIAVR